MEIRPIKSEADYETMLEEIETLMGAEADLPEGDRLDVLVTLIEVYERDHYPIDFPDPVEAIKFRMEQQGLTVDDLVPVIGRKDRVYEILARKRPLTLRMIEGLHGVFQRACSSVYIQHIMLRRRLGGVLILLLLRMGNRKGCPYWLWNKGDSRSVAIFCETRNRVRLISGAKN